MRLASALMTVLLLFSAAVQYNDPDPIRWATLYGMAAVLSGLAAARVRIPWMLPAALAAVATVWAALWAVGLAGRAIDWGQVFGFAHMINAAVEETRETLGLLIVAVWMAVLAWRAARPHRQPA